MGYIPTEWQTGDTITAEKLNNMEQGIATANTQNTVFTITETNVDDVHTLSKTWQEISNEYESGNLCVIRAQTTDGSLYNNFVETIDVTHNEPITYRVVTSMGNNYLCDSTDAYPVYDGSET